MPSSYLAGVFASLGDEYLAPSFRRRRPASKQASDECNPDDSQPSCVSHQEEQKNQKHYLQSTAVGPQVRTAIRITKGVVSRTVAIIEVVAVSSNLTSTTMNTFFGGNVGLPQQQSLWWKMSVHGNSPSERLGYHSEDPRQRPPSFRSGSRAGCAQAKTRMMKDPSKPRAGTTLRLDAFNMHGRRIRHNMDE